MLREQEKEIMCKNGPYQSWFTGLLHMDDFRGGIKSIDVSKAKLDTYF